MASPAPVIADRKTTISATDATSHVVNLPTNIVSGDVLFIWFVTDGSPTHTTPTGWTLVGSILANASAARGSAYVRDADGSEGATVTITISASETAGAFADRIPDGDPIATNLPEMSTGANANSTNPDPDNLTPTGGSKDYLWYGLVAGDRSTSTTAAPTSYSDLVDVVVDGNTGCNPAGAHRLLTAASENPGVFTRASGRWGAATIVFYPVTTTTVDKTAVDSATLSEASALTEGYTAVDSAALSDPAATLLKTTAKTGVDSAALTQLVTARDVSLVDAAALGEALGDRIFSAVDSASLTEAESLERPLTDAVALTDVASQAVVVAPIVPTVKVEIAFGDGPNTATYTWTDVTPYIRAIRCEIGRDWELDTMAAGSATFVFDNRDRRFEPGYLAGAYSPNVVGSVPIRFTVTYDSTTYDVWLGLVDEFPDSYPGMKDTETKVKATQALNLLASVDTTTTFSSETAGTRIAALLTEASWPATRRSIASGITLASRVPYCELVLDEIQGIVDTDDGLFFIDQDGTATYQAGTYRAGLTSQATFGDDAAETELRYQGIVFRRQDVHNVWNRIEVVRDGGTAQVVNDVTSQTAHGIRFLKRLDTVHVDDAAALALANTLLSRYKDPADRVRKIVVWPQRSPRTIWPTVLALNISDKITVKRDSDDAAPLSIVCHIEAIRHIIRGPFDWAVEFDLSPA